MGNPAKEGWIALLHVRDGDSQGRGSIEKYGPFSTIGDAIEAARVKCQYAAAIGYAVEHTSAGDPLQYPGMKKVSSSRGCRSSSNRHIYRSSGRLEFSLPRRRP